MILEGEKRHLRDGYFEGKYSTYAWDVQNRQCESSFQQIYSGRGKHIIPKNPKFHRQLLVKSEFHGVTFGLDLKGSAVKCGTQVMKTQMPNIYVVLNKRNFLKDVEKSRYI